MSWGSQADSLPFSFPRDPSRVLAGSVCQHGEAGTAQHPSPRAITLSPGLPIPSQCAHHTMVHDASISSQPWLPIPPWSFPLPCPGQQSPVSLTLCPPVPTCCHLDPEGRFTVI